MSADLWVKASEIHQSRTAKQAEREQLARDVEAYLAAGGEIRQVSGFTETALPRHPSFRDFKLSGSKGGKKSKLAKNQKRGMI